MGQNVSAQSLINEFEGKRADNVSIPEIEQYLLQKFGRQRDADILTNGTFKNFPPHDLKVWRKDKRDVKLMLDLIENEELRLRTKNPLISDFEINIRLQTFADGVWQSYRVMQELITETSPSSDSETSITDKNDWYELNLKNVNIYPSEIANSNMDEILPGRLFISQIPTEVTINNKKSIDFKNKFLQMVIHNNLNTVLILSDTKSRDVELMEEERMTVTVTGAEGIRGEDDVLEAFYRSIGLEVISRSIPDVTMIPNKPSVDEDVIATIKDTVSRISEGRSVLLLLTGPTPLLRSAGLVIGGLLRAVGLRRPLDWMRNRLPPAFSEGLSVVQEGFLLHSLPLVVEEGIAERNPSLVPLLVANHLS